MKNKDTSYNSHILNRKIHIGDTFLLPKNEAFIIFAESLQKNPEYKGFMVLKNYIKNNFIFLRQYKNRINHYDLNNLDSTLLRETLLDRLRNDPKQIYLLEGMGYLTGVMEPHITRQIISRVADTLSKNDEGFFFIGIGENELNKSELSRLIRLGLDYIPSKRNQ